MTGVNAIETYDRPLIDDGSDSPGTSTKLAEDAQSSQETTLKEMLEKIYNLFSPRSNNLKPIIPTRSPSPTSTVNTGNNQNNDNLLPTGAYPSITYFPQKDSTDILNDPGLTYDNKLVADVQACLQNRSLYETAERHNGIPWVILAGIHNTEGNCNLNQSVISGRKIGEWEPDLNGQCSTQDTGPGKPKFIGYTIVNGKTVTKCAFDNPLDSAIYAGVVLKRKNLIGDGAPKTHEELVYALAGYNGWGNVNCGGNAPKYTACPPYFKGEDHVAPWNLIPYNKHAKMYKVYCQDGIPCVDLGLEPELSLNMGSLTGARIIKKLLQ